MTYSNYQAKILVVDDEPEICSFIQDALTLEGMHCTVATNCKTVEAILQKQTFDVVISDISMPEMSGLDLLGHVNNFSPSTKTILMTAHRRVDWAQEALRLGAFDYLEKPFNLKMFYKSVNNALQQQRALSHKVDPARLIDRHCHLVLDEQGGIQFVSGQFATITGLNPGGIIGVHFNSLITPSVENKSSRLPFEQFNILNHLVANGQKMVVPMCRGNGESFDAQLVINKITVGESAPFYSVDMIDLSNVMMVKSAFDLSNQVKGESVSRDQLTGLPNHRAFHDELENIRYKCRQDGMTMSLILIDVMSFHAINTAYGFSGGDDVLVELSAIIRKETRLVDHVARFSGDQFAIILPEINGVEAVKIGSELCHHISAHQFIVGGSKVLLKICSGVVECQNGFIEGKGELIFRVQEALEYARKSTETKCVLWFDTFLKSLDDKMQKEVNEPEAVSADQYNTRLRKACMDITQSLIAAVEAKDPFTKNHSMNVANYAEKIGLVLGYSPEEISVLRCAATLHDIGKIGTPDAVLTKPSRLTDDEFEVIKCHAKVGADILSHTQFLLKEALLVLHHHERYDGKGYPEGLRGDAIPEGARIINICDAIDCMLNVRSYKKGFDLAFVVEELEINKGLQFDPKITTIAIDLLKNHHDNVQYPSVKA
jgi:diguanylate cyclase (GGDEF)-like protein/putative nucleotidyltransferase with HDIG domain